jgi:hypothetical protein
MIKFAGAAALKPLLARAWPSLQKAGNLMVPGGAPTPGQFGINLANTLVPNAIFAGLSGASLPEGSSYLDRGLAAGENFLGSTAIELGAQALAGGALRMAGTRLGARPGGRVSPGVEQTVRSTIAFGVPTAAWSLGMVPQPTANRVYSAYEEARRQEAEQQMQAEQMQIAEAARQQAFAEMTGLGFGPARQAYSSMFGGGFG